jgi:hypothetical protein
MFEVVLVVVQGYINGSQQKKKKKNQHTLSVQKKVVPIPD